MASSGRSQEAGQSERMSEIHHSYLPLFATDDWLMPGLWSLATVARTERRERHRGQDPPGAQRRPSMDGPTERPRLDSARACCPPSRRRYLCHSEPGVDPAGMDGRRIDLSYQLERGMGEDAGMLGGCVNGSLLSSIGRADRQRQLKADPHPSGVIIHAPPTRTRPLAPSSWLVRSSDHDPRSFPWPLASDRDSRAFSLSPTIIERSATTEWLRDSLDRHPDIDASGEAVVAPGLSVLARICRDR